MACLDTVRGARAVAFAITCAATLAATTGRMTPCRASDATPDDPIADADLTAAIELREGLAIPISRERRSAVNVDPIAIELIGGTWTMPRAGDTVTLSGGQPRKWELVKAAADGWFSGPALRGGYLATSFSAADDSVMMLESAGHAMVYASGEPRAGDIYSNGYVNLPVQIRKGQNVLLFQVGRGRLKARLTRPKGTAFLQHGRCHAARSQGQRADSD